MKLFANTHLGSFFSVIHLDTSCLLAQPLSIVHTCLRCEIMMDDFIVSLL